MITSVLSSFVFSLLCSAVFSQPDCNFGGRGMTCEVRNCLDQTNETVTCAKSPMRNEPCTCRRIRSFLRRNDIGIDNVQMQCNQQSCNVSCDDGFIGDNVTYLCNDSSDCCTPIGDQEIVCKREQCIQNDSGSYIYSGMGDMACESCEISSCYELGDNETVICAEDRMLCEPCACRRIRRYLTMGDIDNVQMQCSQELCNVSCGDGFIGDDVMYLCNRNCCIPVGDQEITCCDNSRGRLQIDETVTCPKSNMQNEPCTCRRIRRCLDDTDNVQMQCNQQSCTVSCDNGFIGDNVTYLCNDSSNCCTPIGDQEITCEKAVSTSNSDRGSGSIIGGVVVGGVIIILLLIIVVLCIVILCMRRSYKKNLFTMDNEVYYESINLNTDVRLDHNPSYVVATPDMVLYSTVKPQDSSVSIINNEDEYNYVQPNEFNELDGSNTNEVGEDRTTVFSTTKADHSSHDATSGEYDYAYAQDDRPLHHSIAANTTSTGDTKITQSPYLALISNGAKPDNGSAAK